jgi:hypothetical protein
MKAVVPDGVVGLMSDDMVLEQAGQIHESRSSRWCSRFFYWCIAPPKERLVVVT